MKMSLYIKQKLLMQRLTPIEKDIIMKHMWPLTAIPPRYPESFLVSFIDKLIASKGVAKDVLNGRKK